MRITKIADLLSPITGLSWSIQSCRSHVNLNKWLGLITLLDFSKIDNYLYIIKILDLQHSQVDYFDLIPIGIIIMLKRY